MTRDVIGDAFLGYMKQYDVKRGAIERLCHVYGREVHFYTPQPKIILKNVFHFPELNMTVGLDYDIGYANRKLFTASLLDRVMPTLLQG